MKRKKSAFYGPEKKKADFSTQKFRHNHHHRNNKRKNKLRRGEEREMGRRRRRTCTWQFSLIPSSTHTHTHNFWLEYWERDRFTCTVAVCTRTEGRAERQMAASKNPSKHSMLPSPPSSFHFDWKTATFYPKKKKKKKNQFKKRIFSLL